MPDEAADELHWNASVQHPANAAVLEDVRMRPVAVDAHLGGGSAKVQERARPVAREQPIRAGLDALVQIDHKRLARVLRMLQSLDAQEAIANVLGAQA